MSTEATPTRHVPARDLPIQASVSAVARAQMGMTRPAFPGYPPVDQLEEWRARICTTPCARLAWRRRFTSSRPHRMAAFRALRKTRLFTPMCEVLLARPYLRPRVHSAGQQAVAP